ncbi:MAG TPA: hypothetical protein VHL58_09330 [Thermoanaerobaculia bacterium]|nr:hypothetical protein [Thermoanaerobaculia bacterium]
MLVRYRLSADAKRRQFLEGLTPSQSQMVEFDVHSLTSGEQRRLVRLAEKAKDADGRAYYWLSGEYEALTLEELLSEVDGH